MWQSTQHNCENGSTMTQEEVIKCNNESGSSMTQRETAKWKLRNDGKTLQGPCVVVKQEGGTVPLRD